MGSSNKIPVPVSPPPSSLLLFFTASIRRDTNVFWLFGWTFDVFAPRYRSCLELPCAELASLLVLDFSPLRSAVTPTSSGSSGGLLTCFLCSWLFSSAFSPSCSARFGRAVACPAPGARVSNQCAVVFSRLSVCRLNTTRACDTRFGQRAPSQRHGLTLCH